MQDERIIAVFGQRRLYNGGGGDLKLPVPFDFIKAERALGCPYCGTRLKRWVDPRASSFTLNFDSEDLDASKGEDGLQLDDYVAYCELCSFWMGRGTRSKPSAPNMNRVVVGTIRKFEISDADVPADLIIRHLHSHHNLLSAVDPFRAEDMVADLLRDVLGLDVEKVGGRKDRGVDAYVLSSGERRGLVQVKWRRDSRRAEGVRVVREILGTMIARGVPAGYFVSTRETLSREARQELRDAASSPLLLRPLKLTYIGYQQLLRMIDSAAEQMGGFRGPPSAALRIIAEMSEHTQVENTFFDRWSDTPW